MGTHTDLTTEQVAEELGFATETVRRLLLTGVMPGYKAGLRQWRVTRAALDQYKAAGGARRPGRPGKNEAE